MKKRWMVVFLSIFVLGLVFLRGFPRVRENEICINEVCNRNLSVISDDEGKYPRGYIELYNKSDEMIDLTGYRITDSLVNKSGGSILSNLIIKPKSFKVLMADATPNEKQLEMGYVSCNFQRKNLYLFNPAGELVDWFAFEDTDTDMSYGRVPDGDANCGIQDCSPYAGNSAAEGDGAITLDEPVFSKEEGFYQEEFLLELSAQKNQIYYTLDGSEPDMGDYLYTEPISISIKEQNADNWSVRDDITLHAHQIPASPIAQAVIVRAAAFRENGEKSKTVTKTYFVGENTDFFREGISVLSVVSSPDNLFSYEDGIMVLGEIYDYWLESEEGEAGRENDFEVQGNFSYRGRKWEREGSISLFDGGRLCFRQDVGLRIRGHSSNFGIVKGLNLCAREAIDNNSVLQYDFWDNGVASEKLMLKYYNCILRDCFINEMVKGTNIVPIHYEPVYVFLNGEYYGTCALMEKMDEQFFENYCNVETENVIVLKGGVSDSPDDIRGEQDYEEVLQYAVEHDMSVQEHYDWISARVDISNLIDYYCTLIFFNAYDNLEKYNMLAWRSDEVIGGSRYADGRWRWGIYDVDDSMEDYTENSLTGKTFGGRPPYFEHRLMKGLLKNKEFRKQFVERFSELMDNQFSHENTVSRYRELAEQMEQPIVYFEKYWYDSGYSEAQYEATIEKDCEFLQNRRTYIEKYLKEYFGEDLYEIEQ